MQASNHIADPYDLTGQVTLVDYMPEFKGNYSMVFRGSARGTLVAVKVIEATGEPRSVRRKVLRERVVWASLWHQNIQPYYGFADDASFGPVRAPYGALISPWYNNGDASRFLNQHGELISVDSRIKIWQVVTDGVAYLHSQTPVIVHGDLKPGNVLIDDIGNPRICDFGLAQIFFDEPGSGFTTTTEHTGTERYLAPELVIDDADVRPTMASDVYALGCLGLDLIYLQQPYSHRKNNTRGIIFVDIRRGVPPARGLYDISPGILSLLQACWIRQPYSRPSAFTITRMLRKLNPIFPPEIVDRIMGLLPEIRGASHSKQDVATWRGRTKLLLALSLVSREYRKLAIPYLYGEIRFLDLEIGAVGPARLLATLKSNAENTLTRDRRYESYTRFFSCHTDSAWVSKLFPGDFETVWALIRRFDVLKTIVVKWGYGEERFINPYDTTIHPKPLDDIDSVLVTSVTFAGLTLRNVMDGLQTATNLRVLQELRIVSPAYAPLPNSTPDSMPSLESLFIEGTSQALDFFLVKLSRWDLPQLRSFHLICQPGGSEPPSQLEYFLYNRGRLLQKMICQTYKHRLSALPSVLRHCPNLQSISYPIWEPYPYAFGFRHKSITSMCLLHSTKLSHTSKVSGSSTRPLERFGHLIRAQCPQLSIVEVLIRGQDGVLQRAALINVRHGTVFEWDVMAANKKFNRTGWIQTAG